jgi:hypothetical protein
MKTLTKIGMILFVATSLACGGFGDGGSPWSLEEECEGGCEEPAPLLEGTYVSGHLGNYRDCPEGGFTAEGEPRGTSTDGDSAGACAPGTDCESFTSCEDGQMTVQITNTGDSTARGLQVTTIELFDSNDVSRAELPLIDLVDTSTNETFEGTVAQGETVSLRVVFLGPDRPYDLLNTEDDASGDVAPGRRAGTAGTLEVTFTADNHGKLTIESGELYPVPSIDT